MANIDELLNALSGGAATTAAKASPFGAIASVIPSALQFLTGRKQNKLAGQLSRTPRPEYEIAKPLYENEAIARNMVGSGLPGADFLRGRIDRVLGNTTGAASRTARGTTDALAVISNAASSAMDKEAEIGYKGAQYRDMATSKLMGANTILAGELNKKWDWDKRQKYLENMAAASALKNAGMHNQYQGVNDAIKGILPLLNSINLKKKKPKYDTTVSGDTYYNSQGSYG